MVIQIWFLGYLHFGLALIYLLVVVAAEWLVASYTEYNVISSVVRKQTRPITYTVFFKSSC